MLEQWNNSGWTVNGRSTTILGISSIPFFPYSITPHP